MQQEQSNKGYRFDPLPRGGASGISFEPIQFFEAREMAARTHHYDFERRFWAGIDFSRDLVRSRAKVAYRELLPICLIHLFAKSINDLLAAVSVTKSGYPFQSWSLIRGGFEAAELMDYLIRYTDETQRWADRERRFEQLSWLRNKLPKTQERRTCYNAANDFPRATLRPRGKFGAFHIEESETI